MNTKLNNHQIESILILNEELSKIKAYEGKQYKYHKNEDKIYKGIMSCCLNEDFNALDIFQDRGLEFNACSTFGQGSVLYDYVSYLASDKKTEDNFCKCVKVLLDYGSNPNFVSSKGINCLMASIHTEKRFKLLLDYKADPLLIPDKDYTDIVDFISNMLEDVKNNTFSYKYEQNKFERNIQNLVDNMNYAKTFIQKKNLNTYITKECSLSLNKKKKML